MKEVKEATLPADINPSLHPYALTTAPNMDLLKKQRSYSIDETREQLRQGRPVHREAITAGAVDIHSFIYGDEAHQAAASTAAPVAQHAVEASAAAPAAPSGTPSKSGTRSRGGSHDHTFTQTPKKISAASWAAMVKSSAAATEGATAPLKAATPEVRKVAASSSATPGKDAKAASSGDKKKSSATATPGKDAAGKSSSGGAGENKEGRRDRKKTPKEGAAASTSAPADSNKDTEGTAGAAESATTAAPEGGDASAASTAAAGEASPTSGGAWGGKATFANIVKLKSAEDDAAAATSPVKPAEKPAAAPAAKPSASGNKSNSGRDSRSGASGSKPSGERPHRDNNKEEGHGRRNREERKDRDRDANRTKSSSSSGANASGVWVKETLPALKK